MTDQSTDTTNAQFGEPMSFIGITYKWMGEGLFTGAEVTQSHHQKSTLAWVTAHKLWKPRVLTPGN